MRRKTLALIMAIITIATSLTGCGTEPKTQNTTTKPGITETADSTADGKTDEPTKVPDETSEVKEPTATPDPTAEPTPTPAPTTEDLVKQFEESPCEFGQIYTDEEESVNLRILTFELVGDAVGKVTAEEGYDWYRFWVEIVKNDVNNVHLGAAWDDFGCVADGEYMQVQDMWNDVGITYGTEKNYAVAVKGYGYVQVPENAKEVWLVYEYGYFETSYRDSDQCRGWKIRTDGVDIESPELNTYYNLGDLTDEHFCVEEYDISTAATQEAAGNKPVYKYPEGFTFEGLQFTINALYPTKFNNVYYNNNVPVPYYAFDIEVTVKNITNEPIFGFDAIDYSNGKGSCVVNTIKNVSMFIPAGEEVTLRIPCSTYSPQNAGDTALVGIGHLIEINPSAPGVIIEIHKDDILALDWESVREN